MTAVMVIGGKQGNDSIVNNKTFIFDINHENRGWKEGPELNVARVFHSCSKIKSIKDSSNKFSIIVVGGDGDMQFNVTETVEILDEGSNNWRPGPNLPIGLDLSQIVELPDGGIILVAGRTYDMNSVNTIFKLDYAADDEWKELPQMLNIARDCHVAFLIPDEITKCY